MGVAFRKMIGTPHGQGLELAALFPRQAPAVLASPPAPHLSPPPRPRMWRTLAWTRRPTLHLAPPQIPGSLAREPHRARQAVELSLWSQRGHGPCRLRTRTHHSLSYPPQALGGWRLWLEEVSPAPPQICVIGDLRGGLSTYCDPLPIWVLGIERGPTQAETPPLQGQS